MYTTFGVLGQWNIILKTLNSIVLLININIIPVSFELIIITLPFALRYVRDKSIYTGFDISTSLFAFGHYYNPIKHFYWSI